MADREQFNDDEVSDKDESSSSEEDGSSSSSSDDSDEGDRDRRNTRGDSDDDSDEGDRARRNIRDDSDDDDEAEDSDDEEEGLPKKQEEYEDEVEQLTMEDEGFDDHRIKKKDKGRNRGGMFSRSKKNKEDRPEQPGRSLQENKSKKRKRWLVLLSILLVIAIIGGAIGIALYLKGKDKDEGNVAKDILVTPAPSISSAPSQSSAPSISPSGSNITTNDPEETEVPTFGGTESPTSAPTREITFTVTETELLELITANSPDNGEALLYDIESPQQAAFLWLQNVDNFWRNNLPQDARRLRTQKQQKKIEARALQRYRMMAFYYGTNGEDWVEQGFWGDAEKEECFWGFNRGDNVLMNVGCDDNHKLTKLIFIDNNIGGFLVPELGQLTDINELEIDNDVDYQVGLSGGLPETFRFLRKMKNFKILGNNFTEPIIGDLWVNWDVVTTINLARNGIPGPLPAASLAKLNTVEIFHLGGNNLEGPIPPEIGGLSAVKLLVLANNNLEGDLPSQLSDLTKLDNINLMYNKLTGPFPDIRKMNGFSGSFVLTGNSFSGQIPDYFDSVPQLKELRLSRNNFSGTVPDLTPLKQLAFFEIDNIAGLRGQIPEEVCDVVPGGRGFVDCGVNPACPDSENLFCCNCCACISAPDDDEAEEKEEPTVAPTKKPTSAPKQEFVADTALLELITSNSPDNGEALLNDIDSPQQAAFLWLQNVDNYWRNNLPEGARRLRTEQEQKKIEARTLQRYRMMTFYYGTNGGNWIEQGFWGDADKEECFWGNNEGSQGRIIMGCDDNQRMTQLVFKNNNVGGFLVPELGQLTELNELEINNDGDEKMGLTGGLPDTFRLLRKIKKFTIIGNRFTEPIIGDLWVDWDVVSSIDLARSGIPGPLPAASLAKLNTVEIFHLGGNNLEGPIPPEIGGLSAVKLLVFANNNLEGDLPSQLSDLVKISNMNLMYNKLTGPFPDMRKMTEFAGSLVLTGNSFSGQIPDYFDSVPKLKELSLSNNNFSGTVPDLMPLKQLELFEIDGNPGLTGQIPAEVCDIIPVGSGFVDCGTNSACPESDNRFCCECCACIAPETG